MTEWSRRELSFPLIPHAELQALTPLGPKLEDYIRQLEELLRTLMFGIDAPAYPDAESPLFTPGSVIFAGASGGLAEDNSNFFYDDANNRLGVGTNTPNAGIQVASLINFDPTDFSTFLGYQAGNAVTTGAGNVLVGYQTGLALTIGGSNVVMGYQAGYDLTTDLENIIIGYQAGFNQVGVPTQQANLIIGYQAGYTLTTAQYNTLVGYQSGYSLTTNAGSYGNTCLGYYSGKNIVGRYNTYIGYTAGQGGAADAGVFNVGVGSTALRDVDGAGYCVAVGSSAMEQAVTNSNCTAVGYAALQKETSQQYNTAIGAYAATNQNGGLSNTCIGYASGSQNINGADNTIVGDSAAYGQANQSNSYNTIVGKGAFKSITTGGYNASLGAYVRFSGNGGTYNAIVGAYAAYGAAASAIDYNSILGAYAGYSLTTGSSNIFLGYKAGYNQTTNSNLFIVDNQVRATANSEQYLALFYGTLDADTTTREMTLNSDMVIRSASTYGSESLNETDFATHADWDVTGDFSDAGGKATYTHATGIGTLTQTAANMAVAGAANKWYKFTYTYGTATVVVTSMKITTSFAASEVTLPAPWATPGTHTVYFQAAAAPGDFVISVVSTGGSTFTLDDLSLKELQGGDLIVNGALSARSIVGAGGAIPAGADTQIQYNNGGVMGGDAAFTFNDATKVVTAGGLALGAGSITMTGSIGSTGSRITKGWFTDLECTNAMVGGLIALSSSSGVLIKNFNGVTVASFGVGTADSLNTALLGNTVNTGDLTKTGCCIFGTNSAVFRPTADSTTFFQILDADGGTPVLNVDSTNERVGIQTSTPSFPLDVWNGGVGMVIGADSLASTRTDNTIKYGRIGCPHYINAEEPIGVFLFGATDGANTLYLGGGSGLFNAVTQLRFYTAENSTTLTGTERVRVAGTGFVTIGTPVTAETLLEMQHSSPYLTMHNDTHEDTAGGRESRIIAKGENLATGAETTLGYMEFAHDGAANDEKGYWKLYTNDGNDGAAPTLRLTVDSAGDFTFFDGSDFILGTVTGTKIGTATTQLLGFYGVTPVDQPATVADAAVQDLTGTDTVDKAKVTADILSCKNAVNAIIDRLQELGLIA